MKFCGCLAARISDADPDIDTPTVALPDGLTPLLAASQVGSSWVRKVSHL